MKIKVICLNLWIGGTLLDRIIDFLKKENADIVLLQEVFDGQDSDLDSQYRSIQELQKYLDYPHLAFAPAFKGDVGGVLIDQGNAILSKFPLKEMSTVFYDYPFAKRGNKRELFQQTPRNLQHVVAEVGKSKLHLLNTQGIWGNDGSDSPRRLVMSEKILAEVGTNTPLILAGDFNVNPDTKIIRNIENRLNNVFKDKLKTSFNLKRKDLDKFPGYVQAVVDMMFVSSDIKVISHYCPDIDVSDHLPLLCEMEF